MASATAVFERLYVYTTKHWERVICFDMNKYKHEVLQLRYLADEPRWINGEDKNALPPPEGNARNGGEEEDSPCGAQLKALFL